MATNLNTNPFQSTHPLRGATLSRSHYERGTVISIHAPLAGCDACLRVRSRGRDISIHAPLAGCDQRRCVLCFARGNFNPRTPCGVRLMAGGERAKWYYISIHAPLAGCDAFSALSCSFSFSFQSTHPLRGATTSVLPSLCSAIFQSTHPLRGATVAKTTFNAPLFISIHAPLAGCDENHFTAIIEFRYFNPRTPCGVRRVEV